MLISLQKNIVRLFIRATARINFHDCMIFPNFRIFKSACIFGTSEFVMYVTNRFFVHSSRERARLEPDYVCMEDLYGGPEWRVLATVPLAGE